MAKRFIAQIIDEETDEVLTQVSSYSEEGLEEEMGKSKWTNYNKTDEKGNQDS